MRVAIVSLDQIWEDKQNNLLLCEEYIEEASQREVDLIVFPEMTLTGFSKNIPLIAEDINHSEMIDKFQNLAKKYNLAILFGIVSKDGKKALNQSIFLDTTGEILAEYAKIHPFSFSGEDKYFNAGAEIKVVNFNAYKIGLSICYDLRFPELYSALAKRSDLIINIANWPQKRVDHWNTLLKARAIENQIYIVGVNRIGIDGNGLEYQESSNVFNANGETLQHNSYKNMKIYEIDKNFTREFKSLFNTTRDRKVELYKGII